MYTDFPLARDEIFAVSADVDRELGEFGEHCSGRWTPPRGVDRSSLADAPRSLLLVAPGVLRGAKVACWGRGLPSVSFGFAGS